MKAKLKAAAKKTQTQGKWAVWILTFASVSCEQCGPLTQPQPGLSRQSASALVGPEDAWYRQ